MSRRVFVRVLQVLVAVALPVTLVLGSVFLLASDAFVHFEYSKASFPEDLYYSESGYPMPRDEREGLAKLGLASVLQPDGITLLEQARFQGVDKAAFNAREISHMRDVNVLIQQARGVLWGALAVLVLGVAALLLMKQGRGLLRSLWASSAVSLILFAGLGVLIAVGFNTFFTTFHRIFFQGDTWLFYYSDTLIRIYPTKFWFDVSLYLSGGILAALVLIAAGSRFALARARVRSS